MTPLRAPVSLGSLEPDGERRIGVDTPCRFCGYNLRGLVRGQACPECGEVDAPETLEPVSRGGRTPARSIPLDEDRTCYACGYSLRGLPLHRRCPECGVGPGDPPPERERNYGNTRTRPLRDAMLAGAAGERRAWRVGLALATLCVAVATVARIGYLLATLRGFGDTWHLGYALLGAGNSVVWVVAVWLVTPASIGRHWRWMEGPRWAARGLSLMWLVGYACASYRHGPLAGAVPNDLLLGDYGGRLLGAVGAMFLAFILSFVAAEAELFGASRRLNTAVWLLWVPTLLAQVFPSAIGWYTLLLAFVLLCWVWLMTIMTLGLKDLYQHARWAHKLARATGDRAERIESAKRAIDDRVGAAVRPLPGQERSGRD